MPSSEQIKQLADQVLSHSQSGHLQWEVTADDQEFLTVFSNNKFFLKAKGYSYVDQDGDRAGAPSLELYRTSDDTLLLRIIPSAEVKSVQLQAIYDSARAQALGIDEAVETVLDELSKLDIPF